MKNRKKWLLGICLLLLAALEYLPGWYMLRPVSVDFSVDSPAGKVLDAVEGAGININAAFRSSQVQQINSSVHLIIPAGTRVQASGLLGSTRDGTNVVANLSAVSIAVDRPVAFYYRGIKLADVIDLNTSGVAGDRRLRARVRFRLLSALLSLPRYRRPENIERDLLMPDSLELSASARLKGGYAVEVENAVRLVTGNAGGEIKLERAVYNDGRWQALQLAGNLPAVETFFLNGLHLSDVKDAGFNVRLLADTGQGGDQLLYFVPGSRLWLEALRVTNTNDPSFSANISDFSLIPSGGLRVTDKWRFVPESLYIAPSGRVSGLLLDMPDTVAAFGEIDIGSAQPLAGPLEDGDGWFLRTAEALVIEGIDWTSGDEHYSLSLAGGGLRLNRFNLLFNTERGLIANAVGGGFSCVNIVFLPDENQQLNLPGGLKLDFSAERLRLHTNVVEVAGGLVQADAAQLSGRIDNVLFRMGDLDLRLAFDAESLDSFDFNGTLRTRGQTVVELKGAGHDADLSVLAAARTLNFSGNQDCLRVGLPWSRTRVDAKKLEHLIKAAFAVGRAGIREESRRVGRFVLDVRRISRIRFKENAAEVRADGRVTILGPRILGWRTRVRVSFTADLLAEFEVLPGTLVNDSEIGVKMSLERINFKNFPDELERYIPDIIELFRRGALVETSTGVTELAEDAPFGVKIDRARIYPSGDDIMMDLSISMEMGDCQREER